MSEYEVAPSQVKQVLERGEVLRQYPEDQPYESCLMLAFVQGRPLHVVAADGENLDATFVITVYEPDPELWEDDFRTKK